MAKEKQPTGGKTIYVDASIFAAGTMTADAQVIQAAGNIGTNQGGFSISERITVSTLAEQPPHHERVRHLAAIPTLPAGAELLMAWIATPDRLEAALGALEDGFRRIAHKNGQAAATRWYRWQVGRSAGAFFLQKLLRVAGISALLHKVGLF